MIAQVVLCVPHERLSTMRLSFRTNNLTNEDKVGIKGKSTNKEGRECVRDAGQQRVNREEVRTAADFTIAGQCADLPIRGDQTDIFSANSAGGKRHRTSVHARYAVSYSAPSEAKSAPGSAREVGVSKSQNINPVNVSMRTKTRCSAHLEDEAGRWKLVLL